MATMDEPWSRIVDDVFATTGRLLVLQPVAAPDGWWDCDVVLDGVSRGKFGQFFPQEEEPFVATLADRLCDSYLHDDIWGGWPICPDHGTHPLEPLLDECGQAVWKCPIGRVVARIGSLSL